MRSSFADVGDGAIMGANTIIGEQSSHGGGFQGETTEDSQQAGQALKMGAGAHNDGGMAFAPGSRQSLFTDEMEGSRDDGRYN